MKLYAASALLGVVYLGTTVLVVIVGAYGVDRLRNLHARRMAAVRRYTRRSHRGHT